MVFVRAVVLLFTIGIWVCLGRVTKDSFCGRDYRLAVGFLIGQFSEGSCVYLMYVLFLVV